MCKVNLLYAQQLVLQNSTLVRILIQLRFQMLVYAWFETLKNAKTVSLKKSCHLLVVAKKERKCICTESTLDCIASHRMLVSERITFFIQVLLNLAWPYFHSSIAHLIIFTTLFWFKYRSLRMIHTYSLILTQI